jgi:hypothetical protein
MILDTYSELSGIDILDEASICKIWVYKDVLPSSKLSLFNHFIKQATERRTRLNTEGISFSHNGEKIKLLGKASRHNYIKIWDLLTYPEYYYQTADTIKGWVKEQLTKDYPPALRMLADVIAEHAEPLRSEDVIPLRFFINVFPGGEPMAIHSDGIMHQINMDMEEKDMWSATYYLQVPKHGGELWFPKTDFMYRPEVNSLAIFNGNKFKHGVRASAHDDCDRISITVRYTKINDMFWPGHPDKFLYKPNLETLQAMQ